MAGEEGQGLAGSAGADLTPAVVELDQDLGRPEAAGEQVGEHRVLGALDVHLDHIRRGEPEHGGEGGQAVDRRLDRGADALASDQAERGELPFPRRGEAGRAVEVGDPVGMEHEALGELPRGGPLERDGRGVEGMDLHAVARDEVALEADVGADPERIDGGGGAQAVRNDGPAAARITEQDGLDLELRATIDVEAEGGLRAAQDRAEDGPEGRPRLSGSRPADASPARPAPPPSPARSHCPAARPRPG